MNFKTGETGKASVRQLFYLVAIILIGLLIALLSGEGA